MQVTLPPDRADDSGPPPSAGNALPAGTRIGEFEIKALIGVGGFGIVYLAEDQLLGRAIALKEYMPAALAVRQTDGSVAARSERDAKTFDIGLRSFINEARLLAQFDHPALVKVHRFWEANGTAYMVMPLYKGVTLRQAVAQLGAPPDEAWMLHLLAPLTEALQTIHEQDCLHRDIAPDNILILENGRPLLLDFGAARQVIGDATQDLTVILKPGYAPIEQYDNGVAIKQGPWTDVYALAAVAYYCATGKTPAPSVSRAMRDTLVPFSEATMGRFSPEFCQAIESAMSVPVEARIQSIAALRDVLGLAAGIPHGDTTASVWPRSVSASAGPITVHGPDEPRLPDADRQFEFVDRGRKSAEAGGRRRTPWAAFAAALGGVAFLGGLAWWIWGERPEPNLVGRSPTEAAPAEPVAPVVTPAAPSASIAAPGVSGASITPAAPAAASAPAASAASVPSVAPVTQVAPGAAAPPAPSARGPFSVEAILTDVYARRTPEWKVDVGIDRRTVRIERDNLQFRIRTERAGYLYLLMQGSDRSHFYQLFPNAIDADNRIEAGVELVLPRPSWTMVAGGPPGTNRFLALVAPSRRDFRAAGLIPASPDQPIGEFNLDSARVAFERFGAAVFAGEPLECTLGADRCNAYGAATFEIAEIR